MDCLTVAQTIMHDDFSGSTNSAVLASGPCGGTELLRTPLSTAATLDGLNIPIPRCRVMKGKTMARSVSQAVYAAVTALTLFSTGVASAQPTATMPHIGQHAVDGLLARQDDGSYKPVTFDPGQAPFALRNNNWVGMKGPNLRRKWPGQIGVNPVGFARFDDPAYSISSLIELMRIYQNRDNVRSAAAILKHYSPAGDCSGAPSVPPSKRRIGGGCVENQITPPATAIQIAHAVDLQPTDDLDLFSPDGQISHPDWLRALVNAIVTQEVGKSHCPQAPHGENWIGCKVDDGLYNRAVELAAHRS